MDSLIAARRRNVIVSHLGTDISNSSASDCLRFKSTSSGNCIYSKNLNNVLSKDQQQFYEDNGFLVIKNLVPKEDLDKYRERFIQIANGERPKASPTMTIMRDIAIAKRKEKGERFITKLQDWQDDEVLFDYCNHPKIVPYVEAFIGPNIRSVHTMLINKPPDVGLGSSRHPLHQDLWYFPFRPANSIVCSWTAMQKIDLTNGCLVVIPGTHKGELLKHEYPNDGIVNKAYHGIQSMSSEGSMQDNLVPLIMEPGDTVFFHPILIHGSGRNNSQGYRKAISCHYASSTDCKFIKVEGSMQEDIAREVEEMVKVKGLQGISFNDLWRMKSRRVKGEEGADWKPSSCNNNAIGDASMKD